MKRWLILLFLISLFGTPLWAEAEGEKEVWLSGNAYVAEYREGVRIGRNSLEQWTDSRSRIKTYLYFSKPQTVEITLNGYLPKGASRISIRMEHEKLNSVKL